MARRARQEVVLEFFMPFGIQVLTILYWFAGLLGIMLGVSAVTQGIYEAFFDIQILLVTEGIILLSLGSVVFLVAIGMTVGTTWAVRVAKTISSILVAWAAIGTVLGAYTAYSVPAGDSTFVLYAMVAWLLFFGMGSGLVGLAYLQGQDGTVRKYSEYVIENAFVPTRKRLPSTIKRNIVKCLECNAELKPETAYCSRCGAPQEIENELLLC